MTLGRFIGMGSLAFTMPTVMLGACSRESAPESATNSRATSPDADSARVAGLAIAAIERAPENLAEYRVTAFSPDHQGWLLTVVRRSRTPYAGYDDSGGIWYVRVWRGDSVSVFPTYR